jgi:hypothetical protein
LNRSPPGPSDSDIECQPPEPPYVYKKNYDIFTIWQVGGVLVIQGWILNPFGSILANKLQKCFYMPLDSPNDYFDDNIVYFTVKCFYFKEIIRISCGNASCFSQRLCLRI